MKLTLTIIVLSFLLLVGCSQENLPNVEIKTDCQQDSDCVFAECCHPTSCVLASEKPVCNDVACSLDCKPGTLDCGGSCACIQNKCVGVVQR